MVEQITKPNHVATKEMTPSWPLSFSVNANLVLLMMLTSSKLNMHFEAFLFFYIFAHFCIYLLTRAVLMGVTKQAEEQRNFFTNEPLV